MPSRTPEPLPDLTPPLPYAGTLPVRRPMVRRTDPAPSAAAADVVRPELSRLQARVLEAFERRGPMSARTAERLAEFRAFAPSTVRKRISELAADGLLVPAGTDTATGRTPATVYAAASTLEEVRP